MDNSLSIMKALFFNTMDHLYVALPKEKEPDNQVKALIDQATSMGWISPDPFMVGRWKLEVVRR